MAQFQQSQYVIRTGCDFRLKTGTAEQQIGNASVNILWAA